MCESVFAACKRFCKLTPCESEDETKTLAKMKKIKYKHVFRLKYSSEIIVAKKQNENLLRWPSSATGGISSTYLHS